MKQVSALQPIKLSAYMAWSMFIIVTTDISVAALKDLMFQGNIFNYLFHFSFHFTQQVKKI